MMTPHLHQEIVRQRHTEAVHRAERLQLTVQAPTGGDGVSLSVGRRLRRLALGRAAAPEPRVLRPAS